MWSVVGKGLAACVVGLGLFVALGGSGMAQPVGKAGGTKSLEGLLKETPFAYKTIQPGFFKVTVEGPGGAAMIIFAQEKTPGWKDSAGNPMKVIWLSAAVTPPFPKAFKAPPGMLRKIAEMNDQLLLTSLGLGKEKDGESIFYNSSFLLANADAKQLTFHFYLMYNDVGAFRKVFLPFLEEGK
jgi:hypothetical protein